MDKRNRIFRAKYGTANSRRTPTMPRGGYVRSPSPLVTAQNVAPRKVSFADIHMRAIEQTAPPSMILDANADILHMSEKAGRYLRHVGGEMSRNLLTLINPQLRLEVRTTLFQIHQSGQPLKSRQVGLDRDGRRYLVDLLAQPYRDEESDGDFVLIMFEEVEVDPADLIEATASHSDNMAHLDVTDSGVGLAAEHLNEVFDLFGQAETQHATHQREGLGIGLSLVRQLTEAHGGSVEVKSEGLGKGCTFTIRLPLSKVDAEQAKPQPSDRQSGRLSGLIILLVDDSPDVLDTLKLLLEMEDAQVIAFDQPLQALQAAQGARFDVVISDLGMPGMNGHELMQALRELPHVKHIPAIALTGYGASFDMQKFRQSGFNQHIGKPVSYDELIDTIEQLRRLQMY